MSRTGPAIFISEDMQLTITLVEGKNFSGININSFAVVICGEEERQTNVQPGSNNPYFNQVFGVICLFLLKNP